MSPTLEICKAAELPWLPVPGLGGSRVKLLRADAESGEVVFLAQLPAGARFPRHVHLCPAVIWTLRGTWRYEEGEMPEGSLTIEPPGLDHEAASVEDCEVLVFMHSADGRFMRAFIAGRPVELDMGFFRKAAALNRVAAQVLP